MDATTPRRADATRITLPETLLLKSLEPVLEGMHDAPGDVVLQAARVQHFSIQAIQMLARHAEYLLKTQNKRISLKGCSNHLEARLDENTRRLLRRPMYFDA